ncbi:DUF6575 domain-containing protein [Paenibacillus validus]|uniref:DUF6575 domain-containing protein n=1 Tax=Paenibacillus validus TaxID=44253 RepID=A0A7X2ZDD9_9BACL|nr:DUF6575 domain-containing protein [Paenibacillus validus]MUG72801.1 hypothetical protein [Paenibacillus validus]
MDYNLPFPIGDLKIIEVFEYIDGPKIFSCENSEGQIFVTNWIDTSPQFDTWFYVPVSKKRLTEIRSGVVSLRDCILRAEQGLVYEVVTPVRGTGEVLVNRRNVDSIIEDELPDEESYIEVSGIDADYREDTLLPAKKEVIKSAQLAKRDVLDISFNTNNSHEHEIDAYVLGSALLYTQDIVSFIPLQKKTSGRYKLAKERSEKSKLKAVGFYAASFGVRLESEATTDLFGDTELSKTLEIFMSLIDSTKDIKRLKIEINNLNLKVIQVYYDFLKLLDSENVELIAEWASPNEKHMVSRLDKKDILSAINAINEENKIDEHQITVKGQLVGINVKRNKFNLITENDEHIHGFITETLRKTQFTVPLNVEANIKERTEANLLTGKETITYTLMGITPL